MIRPLFATLAFALAFAMAQPALAADPPAKPAAAAPQAPPAMPDFDTLDVEKASYQFNHWSLDLARYAGTADQQKMDEAADRLFAAHTALSMRFPARQDRWDDDLIQAVQGFAWDSVKPIAEHRIEQLKAKTADGKIDRWSPAVQAMRNHFWMGKDAVFAGPLLGGGQTDVAKDYKGKWVLVQVWDMGCGPCLREIPHIQAMLKKMGDKAPKVVGVCLDGHFQEKEIAPFLTARKVPWPQIFDGKGWHGQICKDYKINSIPTVFLVSPDGKIEDNIQQDTFGWAVERAMHNYAKRKAEEKKH